MGKQHEDTAARLRRLRGLLGEIAKGEDGGLNGLLDYNDHELLRFANRVEHANRRAASNKGLA